MYGENKIQIRKIMAAPINWCARGLFLKRVCLDRSFVSNFLQAQVKHNFIVPFHCVSNCAKQTPPKTKWRRILYTAGAVMFGTAVATTIALDKWSVYAESVKKPDIKPTRRIQIDTDPSGLKLTLFQYQTCPFCCKARAYLDYNGISYDVVEVNSVFRKEIKWSKYKKVPILLCDGVGENGFLQICDSSVIISLLESHLSDPQLSLDQLLTYYPCLETKEGSKTKYEFQNKYFLMFPEKNASKAFIEQTSKERKWRQWTDDVLVHVLSPNIYRTPYEALHSFHYFSDVGNWENIFPIWERLTVIYVGAAAMFVLGRILKKKYNLKDDVRQSLYDSCIEWTKALGENKFMGGDSPNLADLSVYGTLHAIEGCKAFDDLINNTDIGSWYFRTKKEVISHAGANRRIIERPTE